MLKQGKVRASRSMTKEELAGEIYDINKKNGYKNPYSRKKAINIMVNGLDTVKGFTKAELAETRDSLLGIKPQKQNKAAEAIEQPKTTKHNAKPKKVYRNAEGKVIYKQSTDQVGDTLINQAGVKYKITGERYTSPRGRNDEGVQVRILTLTPDRKTGLSPFEVSDGSLEKDRKIGILARLTKKGKLGREGKKIVKKKMLK